MLMVHLLVQSRLPVVGSLLSDLLNHLDDLLPGLAGLGEDVDREVCTDLERVK